MVGLDPRPDRMPEALLREAGGTADAVEAFCKGVVDVVAEAAVGIKIQAAFFEALGIEGMKAYAAVLQYAREKGLLAIGDVKRGDIGSTSLAYARAHLKKGADFEADAITVNPFFGEDGVEPFVETAIEEGKGVFLLARTSNPSAAQLQEAKTGEETSVSDRIAVMARRYNSKHFPEERYGPVGLVVGATVPPWVITRLREHAPSSIMLMPGLGAQGGDVERIAQAADQDGTGVLVPVSRSVLYPADGRDGADWQSKVAERARDFKRMLEKTPGA